MERPLTIELSVACRAVSRVRAEVCAWLCWQKKKKKVCLRFQKQRNEGLILSLFSPVLLMIEQHRWRRCGWRPTAVFSSSYIKPHPPNSFPLEEQRVMSQRLKKNFHFIVTCNLLGCWMLITEEVENELVVIGSKKIMTLCICSRTLPNFHLKSDYPINYLIIHLFLHLETLALQRWLSEKLKGWSIDMHRTVTETITCTMWF